MPPWHVPAGITGASPHGRASGHDQFILVRIVIVTGLRHTAVARVRFVQHPMRDRIYLVHFAWTLFLLLVVVHVFEFGLQRIEVRTFEIHFFVICYAALFLLPSISIRDRTVLPAQHAFLADLVDAAIKGVDHFSSFGAFYPARQGVPFAFDRRHVYCRPALSRRLRAARDRAAEMYWIPGRFEALA